MVRKEVNSGEELFLRILCPSPPAALQYVPGSFSLPTCLQGNRDQVVQLRNVGKRNLWGCTFLPGASWLAHCFPPAPAAFPLALPPALDFIPQSVLRASSTSLSSTRDCPARHSCLPHALHEEKWAGGLVFWTWSWLLQGIYITYRGAALLISLQYHLPLFVLAWPGNSLATDDSCPRFINIFL